MGTRSLTMVIDCNGETKIAQYGQFDGYPAGVGIRVLRFLRNKELVEKLISKLPRVRFLDENGVDREFVERYEKNKTREQEQWFDTYCARALANMVLENVANSEDIEIVLINREETAKNDGWVDYSYVINFKENTFGVYGHIDQSPIKVYALDMLPEDDEFVVDLVW